MNARRERNVAARQGDAAAAVEGGSGDLVRESAPVSGASVGIGPEERYRMIAEAAYFRAERRAFTVGGELDDWIEAEAAIDRLIESGGSHARRAVQGA